MNSNDSGGYRWALAAVSLLLTLGACESAPPESTPPDASASADASRPDADPGCTTDVATTYYIDEDGDGYGSDELIAVDCVQPEGFVENSLDCHDDDPLSSPDGIEVCDGYDNDCNPGTVEVCPNQCSPRANEGSLYLFCNQGANHPNAETICVAQGMHLARIDSMDEQAYISSERISAFGALNTLWIGGSDSATENTWLWTDGSEYWQGRQGGTAVDGLFSFWAGGEPNNSDGEDCACFRDNESSTGRWDDRGCGDNYRFLCERRLP